MIKKRNLRGCKTFLLNISLYFLLFSLIFFFSINFISATDFGYNYLENEELFFVDLTDTPSSYSGESDKCVTVKNDETGLEFQSCTDVGGDFDHDEFQTAFDENHTALDGTNPHTVTLQEAYDAEPNINISLNDQILGINIGEAGTFKVVESPNSANSVLQIGMLGGAYTINSVRWMPVLDDTYDFGTASYRWKEGWFSGTLHQGTAGSETFIINKSGNVFSSENITADNFYGNVNWSWIQNIFVGTPTLHTDIVNKDYVDNIASAIAFDFFLTNHSSEISGHYNLSEIDLGEAENEIDSASLGAGSGQSIFNFTSQIGMPEFNEIRPGVYDAHLDLYKTGTKSVTITPKLYNISSDGSTRNLIVTFETSAELGTTPAEYDLHGTLSEGIILAVGDRLNLELEANVGASGSNVVITTVQEGTTDSHMSIETSSNAFEKIFVRQDGSLPLTSNWDTSPFNITVGTIFGNVNWSWIQNFPYLSLMYNQSSLAWDYIQGNEASWLVDIDTNETTRFDNLVGTDCGAGDFVEGIDADGTVSCLTPAGGGNPFDQVLNTTSNVNFGNITQTSGGDTAKWGWDGSVYKLTIS